MTYRTIPAEDWIARQPASVRRAGEAKARELIAEVTLRDVREAVKRTQVEVAAAQGTSQDRVSKLEHGEDALVSTCAATSAPLAANSNSGSNSQTGRR